MNTDQRAGTGGFTLIEVLVALTILAVGLLALEALGIGAARMVARAERQGQYTALATAQLEVSLGELREGRVPTDSSVRMTNGDSFRRTVGNTVLGASGRRRYDVSVTVVPKSRGFIGPQDSIRVVGSVIR